MLFDSQIRQEIGNTDANKITEDQYQQGFDLFQSSVPGSVFSVVKKTGRGLFFGVPILIAIWYFFFRKK